jgi:flagellar biosynthesis/type III secretory pathway chaperone
MIKLLDDLSKTLTNQTDLYTNLLNTLHDEKCIILNSSVSELHLNNKKKDVLILQIKLLDESCARILEKIHKKLPDQKTTPTLLKILDVLREPDAGYLKSAYSKLISIAQSVKELNSDNDMLIKGSLRAIKTSLGFLMSHVPSTGQFYENRGQLKTDNFAGPMLKEEA